jgi:hypothetical protein
VQPVAVPGIWDAELFVLGYPALAVYIPEVDSQGRAVVGRQVMQGLVPEPELSCKSFGTAIRREHNERGMEVTLHAFLT